MPGWMSGPSQFLTPLWCSGGVMSARRKHRALNGITQGDVNLGRAGGESNMIRGLQREGLESQQRQTTTESQRRETLLHHRVVRQHFCSPSSLFQRLPQIIFSVFYARKLDERNSLACKTKLNIYKMAHFISLRTRTVGVCQAAGFS